MIMADFQKDFQEFINEELDSKNGIKVLEAGCGSNTIENIKINKEKHITGIDISRKQLARNNYLNKKILGDLQKYEFENNNYDLVVCWDVLEHLIKPKLALDNMSKALKPGGLMVLKLPNLMSFKGLLTRFTPHSLHVLYYKLIYKQPNAGKDDIGPFKTFLKYSVAPNSLKKYANKNGLKIVALSIERCIGGTIFFH